MQVWSNQNTPKITNLARAMRATTHDFDLSSYLTLVHKPRPHTRIRIIGIKHT